MSAPVTDSTLRRSSLTRDVLLIVCAGAVLGIGYNIMLHVQRPGDALAWVRHEPRLASFESLAGGLPEANTTQGADSLAPVRPPASGSIATPVEIPAMVRVPKSTAATPAPVATPAAARPPDATPPVEPVRAAAAPATVSAPSPALPVVPETREPLEVGLDVARRFHAARGALFVDARSAEEYAESHVSGALSLPSDDVYKKPELARALDDRGLPLIVYCGGGDCDLARTLAYALIEGGHKRVLVFKDGLPSWAGAGLPLAKGAQP